MIHHPDRGSRSLSIRYTECLAEAGIDISAGSVGDSCDNALAESVIGLFRTGVIGFFGPWKSVARFEWETLQRVIPALTDHNRWAHSRHPIDMMRPV